MRTSSEGLGVPGVGGLRAQLGKGGKRLGAGLLQQGSRPSQAQAKRPGAPAGVCRGPGGGQNGLRPLERSPGPPQGAPEVLVAGRHLLQQAGDVESSGTHAGCAAVRGRE